MKPIRISSIEWKILGLFLIGFAIQTYFLHLTTDHLVTLYLFGMVFEFTTERAWNYNPILLKSTFTLQDRDVNWIFGLGWVGTLLLGLSAGKALTAWISQPYADIVAIGIVGNFMEQLFLHFQTWKYNKNHWIVTLWTGKPVEILSIPVSVRVGYFAMGLLIHGLVEWIRTPGAL